MCQNGNLYFSVTLIYLSFILQLIYGGRSVSYRYAWIEEYFETDYYEIHKIDTMWYRKQYKDSKI